MDAPIHSWFTALWVLVFFGGAGLWIGIIHINEAARKRYERQRLLSAAVSQHVNNLCYILMRMLIIASVSLLGAGASVAQTPTPPATVPTALVTFYSSGNFWSMGKRGKFMGQIFDGSDRLTYLTAGRFVTFQLDAGKHVFAANTWLSPTQTGGGHLKLDLVAGQHYYVAAYLDNRGVLIPLFRLEQHPCDQAQKETAKVKPLDPDDLHKYGQGHAVIESSFPICTEPQQPPQSRASAN
jgi:hypothetical protein